MTIEFDDATQCYKIPVTGTVGYYRAVVTKLFKRSGKLHVTVGYIPTTSTDDSIINVSSDTPTKYMDYLFERQSGSWYLTGLTESETKAESTESTPAAKPAGTHGRKRCAGCHSCSSRFRDWRLRLRERGRTAPLQTRAWIHRRRNSPPTAQLRHRRTKAQPARRHNFSGKQKYRIQGRCFVSGIFYFRSKSDDHQPVPQVRHHVPDHPQLHQDVVGQVLQAEGPLAQPAAFQQGKGLVHPLVPCLAKALLVELVALEQVARGQRDEVEHQHQQRLVLEGQQDAVAAALLAFEGVVPHRAGAGTADVVALWRWGRADFYSLHCWHASSGPHPQSRQRSSRQNCRSRPECSCGRAPHRRRPRRCAFVGCSGWRGGHRRSCRQSPSR